MRRRLPPVPDPSRRVPLVVDARLLAYNRTGIGRYLRHLYAALGALRAGAGAVPDVTVLYHRTDGARRLRGWWPREAVAWTPPHHRLERWALAVELARLRPRLVHCPDHVCPQPLGWRTVLTVHDLAFRKLPESHAPGSRAYYAALERSVRQATRIICVSDATRRDLLAETGVDERKVRVVYEAPDPAYTPDGPAVAGERPYVVFVGSVEPRKNVAGIVRALARLPAPERPELRLIGAGGPSLEAVRRLAQELGLASDVRFLGPLPTAEIAAQYRGALALVYPSLLEGFGLPILEAMAAGAPVITSGCSSMAEVAGGADELVDPRDDDAIAAAIARLAGDRRYREALRCRGFARARQFSWERAARETLAVFHEALAA